METLNLEFLSLVVDFGLVVLIWMVQLIVYPSFLFYTPKNLISWHKKYTPKITVIVAPLMFLQVILNTLNAFFRCNYLAIFILIFIALIWLITFLYFVPLHQKIETNKISRIQLKRLVKFNWIRTILWSIIVVFKLTYLSL